MEAGTTLHYLPRSDTALYLFGSVAKNIWLVARNKALERFQRSLPVGWMRISGIQTAYLLIRPSYKYNNSPSFPIKAWFYRQPIVCFWQRARFLTRRITICSRHPKGMNEWSLQPARTMGKRPLIAADQPASAPDGCLWYAPTHVTLLTSLGDRSWDSRTFAHRRTSYSKIALSDTRPPSSNVRKPIAGAGEKRVHPAAT